MSDQYLTEFEERLVELVHMLAYGSPDEYGLSLYEVKRLLLTVPKNLDQSIIQSLRVDDEALQKIKSYLGK